MRYRLDSDQRRAPIRAVAAPSGGDDPASDITRLGLALQDSAPVLLRAARRWAPPHQAEDLLQHVYLIAVQKVRTFPGPPPLAWRLAILRNHGRAQNRRARRIQWQRVEAESLPQLRGDVDPATVAARHELLRRMADEVTRLRKPYREVVVGLLSDRSPAEIASDLGRPASTVRTQLERGLRNLRERMDRPRRPPEVT